MKRHIYQTIKDNTTTKDEFNIFFPDIFTFPINRFIYNRQPKKITLTDQNIKRIDLLMSTTYDTTDYDDIVLWLNNIAFKEDLNAGDKFILPDKRDIEDFYINYTL